jgi:hypothetical protein
METGEMASVISPILARIDKRELFPTPGLKEIQNAVLSHHLTMEAQKQEILQTKRVQIVNTPKPAKNYLAKVFDSKGNQLYDPTYHQHDTDGIRWIDRRLIKESPGSYGELTNEAIHDEAGEPLLLYIHRDDSMARLFKRKKGPVVERQRTGMNKPFTWYARAKQDKQSFSRG